MLNSYYFIKRSDGKYFVSFTGISWSAQYGCATFYRTREAAEQIAETFPGFGTGKIIVDSVQK